MGKSNDNIPADEMLLAEAIAAAKARGLGWTSHVPFRDKLNKDCKGRISSAAKCCALGALHITGALDLRGKYTATGMTARGVDASYVHVGNDGVFAWSGGFGDAETDADKGESLGWAFRCAMTE